MNPVASKTIPVKIYLDADTFLEIKAKCDGAGISMSSAGNLALRQWQPAHRIRRAPAGDMPKPGPRRPRAFPGSRAFGGGQLHLRV